MNVAAIIAETSLEQATCPYCQENTSVVLPENYAPTFVYCQICSEKFIIERLAHGFDIFKIEDAPCDSDPDCRVIDMSSCDEQ